MENLIRVHGKSILNKGRVDAAVEAGYRVIVASRDKLQLRYKRPDGTIAIEDFKHEQPTCWVDDFPYYRYPD